LRNCASARGAAVVILATTPLQAVTPTYRHRTTPAQCGEITVETVARACASDAN
jgi:hypothetical protein